MALVVEDGTGKADANSYVSRTDADTLLSFHASQAKWAALSDADKEAALQRATEYLDLKFRWYGQALYQIQALQWPRTKYFDAKGFERTAGLIPTELEKAAAYLAITAIESLDLSLLTEMGQTGALKQYFTEGLNVIFDPKTTEENQFMGRRFPELEMLLKNLGQFKDVDYLKESHLTEART